MKGSQWASVLPLDWVQELVWLWAWAWLLEKGLPLGSEQESGSVGQSIQRRSGQIPWAGFSHFLDSP